MVALECSPISCACRAMLSHICPLTLWSQIILRTRGWKISAPPPGSESTPASFNLISVSPVDSFDAREVAHLDHRERFQVHAWAALLQPADHLQEIFERQIRVQAAHDVEFQRAFARALFGAGINLFQGEVVRTRRAGVAAKGAELAMSDTYVRRIDVPVDIEISHVAVLFFTHVIRQPANGQQVRRAVQRDAIIDRKPLPGKNFAGNRLQPLIGDCKCADFESVEKFKRAKPQQQHPRTTETTYQYNRSL